MSRINAWEYSIGKIKARLSKWKLKTLSIGGRLTLLKSVLGSTPIYSMSLYKVPKAERKITWVQWAKVLASKKYGGLGVSSFFALNRALLFKWVWRFISQDNSLWFRFITALHGNLLANCKLRVGSGMRAKFWSDSWIGDTQLCFLFPRLYALENNKECLVAEKMQGSITGSF
ncbi:hypothetical protein Tco_0137577, partial [Tanacetum coccineum]